MVHDMQLGHNHEQATANLHEPKIQKGRKKHVKQGIPAVLASADVFQPLPFELSFAFSP